MLLETVLSQPEEVAQTGQRSEGLFMLIYDELYQLARDRLRHEAPGQTLQPTALVNEVYLKLIASSSRHSWDNTGHFFAAAARAMRQILIDHARHRNARKRLPSRKRVELHDVNAAENTLDDCQLLLLHEALNELERSEPVKAQLVEMRFFGGMEMEQICDVLNISRATAHRYWTQARAWLFLQMS